MNKKIIHLKNLVMEDFINYKKPSMFLVTCKCDWKCCKEQGIDISICQNQSLVLTTTAPFFIDIIVKLYIKNDITKAVVIGGLEPFLQFSEIKDFIEIFRKYSDDDIVIYTGYTEAELQEEIKQLKNYSNIIIKFGRYIHNGIPRYDECLGVKLASNNQYAKKIS